MKRILSLLLALALLSAACGSDTDSATEVVRPADSAEESSASESSAEESSDAESSADRSSADEGSAVASDVAESGAADDGAFESEAAASIEGESLDSDSVAEAPESGLIEPSPAPETTIAPQPQSGTLTAGDIDDNLNITFFTQYLERTADQYAYEGLPPVVTDDRIIINVVDPSGEPVANALLAVTSGQQRSLLTANAYGTAYLFPSFVFDSQWNNLEILASGPSQDQAQGVTITQSDLDEDNAVTINVAAEASRPEALDVALVIDTTGSMGDELSYLTTEFTSIVGRVSDDYPNVDLRFALVVYRDEGDDYVTQTYDFTGDVSEIQASLNEQFAQGGGDYPEAMDDGLAEALDLDWRTGSGEHVAKVLILNADAPPHAESFDTVLAQAAEARERGIRIYPLAASGVGDTAEYLMRVMATTTGGRHLFLTDDSGVGLSHQEPKVQCYLVSRLDHLLIRVLSSELSTTRIEPLPNQLIRTVGDYDNGYCTDEQ